jgi:hypothetical protein
MRDQSAVRRTGRHFAFITHPASDASVCDELIENFDRNFNALLVMSALTDATLTSYDPKDRNHHHRRLHWAVMSEIGSVAAFKILPDCGWMGFIDQANVFGFSSFSCWQCRNYCIIGIFGVSTCPR